MKKLISIILALLLMLSLCACGGSEPQPYFGLYNAVSAEYSGIKMPVEGEWLEIKSDTKMVIFLYGDEYSGKLEMDGNNFVYSQGGDSYSGVINGDVITIDFDGLIYTYLKDGATMPIDTSGYTLPEAAADAKIYAAYAAVIDGVQQDQIFLAGLGDFFIVLNSDGSGEFHFFGDLLPITYDDANFMAGGDTLSYTTEGDTISFALNDSMSFTLIRVQ